MLDRQGLLGEHAELHAIGATIQNSGGYLRHPEVQRWVSRSGALRHRHDAVAREMTSRGYRHRSPWPEAWVAPGEDADPPPLEPVAALRARLEAKLEGRQP